MSNLLYLPNWTVAAVEVDQDGAYQIDASYDVVPDACGKCGVVGRLYKHGASKIAFVDAPVHGRQTFINVRRPRYRCRDCSGTFVQPLPDMDEERRMTHRCREYIERQCLLKPNTHVSEDVGIHEKVVRQIGARALFGKRPGRVKAERDAAEAARRAAMLQCYSCKALFEPAIIAHHIVSKAATKQPKNGMVLCDTCHRFHTQTWFNHGSASTPKSE